MSTPITFSHPAHKQGPLTIDGINEIKWSYELITSSQATYGGEVVQILGAHVGPIQIAGRVEDRREQERIRKWFVAYMQLAGLTRRDQRPVHVSYPERGWEFEIFPISFPWNVNPANFAPEWQIQAEMSGTESNVLATATITEFNFATDLQGIGFSDAFNVALFEDAQLVGQNFNRLLASWQTGDYQQFGFNPFGDPSAFSETEAEMYTRYFGSEWLIEPEGGSGDATAGGEPSGTLGIVNQIVQVFEANDIPGMLGVAVAIVESGINPDKRQGDYDNDGDPEGSVGDGAIGLFQTFAVSLAGGGAGAGAAYSKQAITEAQNAGYGSPVTKHYPASSQISDAAQWFKGAANGTPSRNKDLRDTAALSRWAQDAQRAGVAYDEGDGLRKFTNALKLAKQRIEEAEDEAGSGSTTQIGKPIARGHIASPFGPRGGRNHDGVDIGTGQEQGVPLYAVVAGRVEHLSDPDGYGNYIILRGTDGDDYLYGHLMNRGYTTPDNARVVAGQQIGKSGNTGSSTGPHLHFEYHPGGYKNPADPMPKISRFF